MLSLVQKKNQNSTNKYQKNSLAKYVIRVQNYQKYYMSLSQKTDIIVLKKMQLQAANGKV